MYRWNDELNDVDSDDEDEDEDSVTTRAAKNLLSVPEDVSYWNVLKRNCLHQDWDAKAVNKIGKILSPKHEGLRVGIQTNKHGALVELFSQLFQVCTTFLGFSTPMQFHEAWNGLAL